MSDAVQNKSTRDAFGEALTLLGKSNPNIVVLTADLAESTRVLEFEKEFPDRFFQVGVAEQNMAGIAAGIAVNGRIPFMTSFSAFSPYGNWLQIRTLIAYSNANVKIVSTHSGLSAGKDGATHQALEDITLMRVLPNMVIISPADYNETKNAVKAAVEHKGPVYIRLTRDATPVFTNHKKPFEIGKSPILKKGKDITIACTGPILAEVFSAAEKMEPEISCEVINFSTIKPMDKDTLLDSAKKTGKVITVEEHQIAGGLGSAVCEILAENMQVPVFRIGINDSFGESGSYSDLLEKNQLNAKHIKIKVTDFLKNHAGN